MLISLAGLAFRLLLWRFYGLGGSDCDGAAYMEIGRNLAAGRGFVTNACHLLFLLPSHFPLPDAKWNPMLPFLLGGAFKVAGFSMSAAKAVTLLFGAVVPPLVFAFTRTLTGRGGIALLAAAFAAFDPTLSTWSLRILTEVGTIAFVAAAFALMGRPGLWARVALGAVLGLAWLEKYQSGALWIGVAVMALLQRGGWRAWLRLVPVVATFLVVISPWLVRNALVFGDPLHTDLRLMLLSTYPQFGGIQRFFALAARPPEFGAFAVAHPARVALTIYGGIRGILQDYGAHHLGSWLLVPFALLGMVALRARWRCWLPFAVFMLVVTLGIAATVPLARYLLAALPAYLALAAAGAVAVWEWGTARVGVPRVALRTATVLVLVAGVGQNAAAAVRESTNRTDVWNPSFYFCPLEYEAAAGFVGAHTLPGEPVFAAETSHAVLLLERPAIRLPFDQAQLEQLRDRYHVRYLVTTERDEAQHLPAWRSGPPPWAHLVLRRTPAEFATAAVAAGYSHLSPLLIYRLDGGTPRGNPERPNSQEKAP